jgi:hypothetical protein
MTRCPSTSLAKTPSKSLRRGGLILAIGVLAASAGLLTAGAALAGVGAEPGDLELLQAGAVVTSGSLTTPSTSWQSTAACPAGFQASADVSEWTVGGTPTEVSLISPVTGFGLASPGFSGSLDAPGEVGPLLNVGGVNASNPGTLEWVVGCYAGVSGTGAVKYEMSTFVSVAAGATVFTTSSSPPPNWAKQSPATSPSARAGAGMAYDSANAAAVMFGGEGNKAVLLNDTWTWNGTTWTHLHPATVPPARQNMAMTYDAATGTAVMFGGAGASGDLNDTWTWNGTTWAHLHPATSPSVRKDAVMTYDAATGNVVLFGGLSSANKALADTWTWNGTTWTLQHPTSSAFARYSATMVYDTATGNVVLFGGADIVSSVTHYLADTWIWNGTTWTQEHPATSPSARAEAMMAYDTARSNVVLFGGGAAKLLSDTWTWNGTTWTHAHPVTSPHALESAAMVYDAAAGNVVMFGGNTGATTFAGTTWTWG